MQMGALRNDFFDGNLSKQSYIDEIFKHHSLLMEYPEFIKNTNIQKLEITDGHLIATTRDKGVRMLCNAHDKRLIPFETLNFYQYEQEEIEMILRLIQCSNAGTVFDIGANIGYVSLCVAKTFPEKRVFSFEPIPSTFEQLRTNIELNGLHTITPLNHGLSNLAGPVEFFFYPEGSGNSSLKQLVTVESLIKIKTHVKTLDEVVEASGVAPDFIKCDVEGAELLVFQGGQKTLKTAFPIVYTEMLRKWAAKFNYHPNDIILYFSDLDYDCFVIHGGKLMPFQAVTEATIETNYVFLHKQKQALLSSLITQ